MCVYGLYIRADSYYHVRVSNVWIKKIKNTITIIISTALN